MGTVNNGQQKLSYDYRERGTAELFNKINYKLHSRGIYSGGEFTKVSDSSLNIAPFICVYDDDTNKLSVRIETTENALVEGVSVSTPWIVGRFTWLNTEENYMDFLTLAQENILVSDIIFGYVDYEDSTMTNDFDYTSKSWEKLHYLNLHDSTPFKVIADEPYSNKVIVQKGGPYFFNGRWVELTTDIESPEVEFPISSFGRKDVVAIDSLTNNIVIIKGFEDSNNLPEIDTQYFPVAILNLPENVTSLVRGHYIEYIHPNKLLTSKDTAKNLMEKLKTVDGDGSGIDLDLLGGKDGNWYKRQLNIINLKKFWTILPPIGASLRDHTCIDTGNGLIAVTRNSNFISYSSDGETWTEVQVPEVTTNYIFMAFGHGLFVIVNNSTLNKIWTTSDFISWNTLSSLNTSGASGIVFVNDRFFVFQTNTTALITSNNGVSWTTTTMPANISPHRIDYLNNTYMLFQAQSSTGSATYYTSTNGTSWTSRALPTVKYINSFIINNKLFMVGCDAIFNYSLFSTTDGISWFPENISEYFDYIGCIGLTSSSASAPSPKIYYYKDFLISHIGSGYIVITEDGKKSNIINILDALLPRTNIFCSKDIVLFNNKFYIVNNSNTNPIVSSPLL